MTYILYYIYNIAYQIFSVAILLFANTYLNGVFIPDSIRWLNGKPIENLSFLVIIQTIILLVETFLLTLLIFIINKKYLSIVIKTPNASAIATRTAVIYCFIIIVFITIFDYVLLFE